jgi:hypothetical protein
MANAGGICWAVSLVTMVTAVVVSVTFVIGRYAFVICTLKLRAVT